MMGRTEFRMWRGKTFVDLPDILSVITLHDRIWRMHFHGMGIAPRGMTMQRI